MVNWNIRRRNLLAGWDELRNSVEHSSERLDLDEWDVMCIQEPGQMAPPADIHKQFKCNRRGGWGASIIVHERFANRVTFNTCGTNWVVVGLDFSDLGWRDMGFVSAHLPPVKKNNVVDDVDYTNTIGEINAAMLQLKTKMPGVRLFEGIDANVELPHLEDAVFTLTGELCTNHGTTSRALDFIEHLHSHGLRACNTWPTETHRDHGS